ncbi:hypothetical protein D3C84_103960 [compost metagenome]
MGAYAFEAFQKAHHWHKGQKYGEHNYTYHLGQVADQAYMLFHELEMPYSMDEMRAVCYLHDILEDTACPIAELQQSFPDVVIDAVVAITKVPGETYPEYIRKVKANLLALRVKIVDTLCNLMNSIKEDNKRRIHKYTRQLQLLTA